LALIVVNVIWGNRYEDNGGTGLTVCWLQTPTGPRRRLIRFIASGTSTMQNRGLALLRSLRSLWKTPLAARIQPVFARNAPDRPLPRPGQPRVEHVPSLLPHQPPQLLGTLDPLVFCETGQAPDVQRIVIQIGKHAEVGDIRRVKVDLQSSSGGFAPPVRMALGAQSTPVTCQPRRARVMALVPVPHPRSSAFP
jgi:hypothetical protein